MTRKILNWNMIQDAKPINFTEENSILVNDFMLKELVSLSHLCLQREYLSVCRARYEKSGTMLLSGENSEIHVNVCSISSPRVGITC